MADEDDVIGLDGNERVIETTRDGDYRVVTRWTTTSNARPRCLVRLVRFYALQFERAGFWQSPRSDQLATRARQLRRWLPALLVWTCKDPTK